MAFFVVLRGADAALSIPLPEAYPTRDAALAALSSALSTGALTLDAEVFVADLSAATPVLVLSAPAPAPAVAAEPAEDESVLEPVILEGPSTEWSALEALGDESSLAAALKRAASSLEDEGIVAPASIESAPDMDEDEPAADTEQASEPAASWPWTNVEAYQEAGEEPADEAEPDDDPVLPQPVVQMAENEGPTLEELLAEPIPTIVSEPLGVAATQDEAPEDSEDLSEELYGLTGGLADAIPDDAPIITSAPLPGEEAYLPRPVILGDYADAPSPALPADPALVDAPAVTLYETIIAEAVGEPAVPEASPVMEGGYEAAGELDLAAYTCQDCVYSNTCPKVGQAAPANCGSFQWRSE